MLGVYSPSIVHQEIYICIQNAKNVNVTCLIHDENFLYENLAKLYAKSYMFTAEHIL